MKTSDKLKFIEKVKDNFTQNILIVINYYDDNKFNIVIALKHDIRYEFNYIYDEDLTLSANNFVLTAEIREHIIDFFTK